LKLLSSGWLRTPVFPKLSILEILSRIFTDAAGRWRAGLIGGTQHYSNVVMQAVKMLDMGEMDGGPGRELFVN
jgi:hypothetical protein